MIPVSIGNSMIWSVFAINTTGDISKLLYVISQAIRRVKNETSLKYHEWYLCQISRSNQAIIGLYSTRKRFVIFACRYFKLSYAEIPLL